MTCVSYKRVSLLVLVFCVSVLGFYAFRDVSSLKVYFLNIGQGDAIFIEAPYGNQMLIDGGADKAVLRELGKVMPFFDRSIDVVMETHPDADHIGGLPAVLNRFDVGVFLEPGVSSDNTIDEEIARIRETKNIESIRAREGMRINLRGGAVFDVLFPNVDVTRFETNTASIVGKLVFGSTTVMFTGDSPQSIEKYLVVRYGERLKSDILKAGHHGSRTSSSREFVESVRPQFVIISAGLNNRYGHPHAEVISLFEEKKSDIVTTAKEGTIRFVSDGSVFERK
jgi:competence protein ComEC